MPSVSPHWRGVTRWPAELRDIRQSWGSSPAFGAVDRVKGPESRTETVMCRLSANLISHDGHDVVSSLADPIGRG